MMMPTRENQVIASVTSYGIVLQYSNGHQVGQLNGQVESYNLSGGWPNGYYLTVQFQGSPYSEIHFLDDGMNLMRQG